ncbi:MAG: hydrogenase small subunit [Haloarculaceae archaeon]|jgi:hydrogenase small subunit
MSQSQTDGARSTTRRNFLKLAGTMATGAVVSEHSTEIASALQQATDGPKEVVWLQGQCCSGCTISLLQGEYPSLEQTLSEFRLDVTFHPTIMAEWGDDAIDSMSKDPDVLIVEGSIPTEMTQAATVGTDENGNPKPVYDWVQELAPNAEYVIAVGNCASFGGWPAAENKTQPNGGPKNVTGARGLQYWDHGRKGVFGPDWTAGSGLPVVNIGGCPPQPDYILLTLASILNGHVPELDDKNRPLAFYEPNIHDQCSLRGEFDRGEFAEHPGDDGCLYKVGCAGPYTWCDDSKRLWNGGTSVCRDVGAPCIGCMEPAFWDRFSPFYEPVEQQNDFGVDVETAGLLAMAGTVAGVGAHVARKAMGYGSEDGEEQVAEATTETSGDDSTEDS